MNVPVNPGAGFNQVLDVMRSEVVTYDTSDGRGKFREEAGRGGLGRRWSPGCTAS